MPSSLPRLARLLAWLRRARPYQSSCLTLFFRACRAPVSETRRTNRLSNTPAGVSAPHLRRRAPAGLHVFRGVRVGVYGPCADGRDQSGARIEGSRARVEEHKIVEVLCRARCGTAILAIWLTVSVATAVHTQPGTRGQKEAESSI